MTAGASRVGGAILRYAPSRFIEPLLGMLALPILTRALGVDGYGVWSVAVLTAGILNTAGFSWIGNCALRFRRVMEDDLGRFFTNLLCAFLLSAGVLTLVILAGGRFLPESVQLSLGPLLWLVFVDALATGLCNGADMLFRARHRSLPFTISRIGQALSRHVVGVGALVLTDGDLRAYFLARIGCMALITLATWSLNHAWSHLRPKAASWATQREFLFFGFPLVLVLIGNTFRTLANSAIVLAHAGEASTGLYSVGVNLGATPLLMFQQVVMLGLYPLAIDAWEGREDILPMVREGLRLFLLISMPAVAGLILLAEPALSVIAGAEYVGARPVLMLMAPATFLFALSQYYSMHLMVAKRTGLMATIALGAGVLNVLLTLIVVPAFGFVYAAASTLTANVILLAAMVRWGGLSFAGAFPVGTFLRAAAATIVMIGAVLACRRLMPGNELVPFAVAVCAGVLVYGGIIWRFGGLRERLDLLKGRRS